MLSDKVKGISLSGTMDISSRIIEMNSRGVEVLDLCVGEPDLPTPEHIKNAAKRAIDENKTKYTFNNGIVELREAIRKKFLNEYNVNYNLDEIIVSNGAKQALFNALQSIISPGDEVIIPKPYYASYPHMVKLAGGIPKFICLRLENNFHLDPDELNQYINKKTRAIIICNPNNPTGAVYQQDELQVLLDIALNNNLIIISDEIYEKFIYDSIEFASLSSFDEKYRNNLVIVNGVSKAYSMTGWRIGYAVSQKEIISSMNKIQSHSTSNACTISQYAALEALTGSQDVVEMQRSIFEERRNLVHEELKKIENISFEIPKGAFYFFINIEEILKRIKSISNSKEFCLMLLNKGHVATVPGSVFGLEGYVRISYAKSTDELKEGMLKLKDAFNYSE